MIGTEEGGKRLNIHTVILLIHDHSGRLANRYLTCKRLNESRELKVTRL